MSSISQTQPALLSQPVLASPPLHRFTVDEYDRIVAAGALESARIELLDGIMVDRIPKSPEHNWTTIETFGMLDGRLPHGSTPRKE
jgi:Uma2 family endonuclease